tara:strand:+ start:9630 stop:10934 length:1305 start_codon:yes stop_codon:yes gene_type:complete
MYKFFIFIIQLILLLTIVTFILSNPFKISLDIGNLKYSFSSNFFASIFIFFIFILYFLLYIFFKSRLSINKFILKNKYSKLEKGYFHFIDAMIAIANKDNRNAIKFHKKMNFFLKDDPSLSLLLSSEVYKIEKKYPELIEVYEKMLKSKKTETLGFRGLMEQNLKNQDYHHAFLYGEKLFNLNPAIEKLYDTLIYIAAKTKNWNQLIHITNKAYSKKIIKKNIYEDNASIGYYEIAKIKKDFNLKDATSNIQKALNLKKNFPPFIKLYLEIISETNNIYQLKKKIVYYWQYNPSKALRLTLNNIISKNKLDNISFINQIIKINSQNEESKKMLIYFAIKDQNWKMARENIVGLIGPNPSKEICLFMADIEYGENSDNQKRDSWIMRANNTDTENNWICKITNKTQSEWNCLSNSGYFNSLVLYEPGMIENKSNL